IGFDILLESKRLSLFAEKLQLDEKDINFTFINRYRKNVQRFPEILLAKDLANRRNAAPLQPIKAANKLQLPSERNCLLSSNFQIVDLHAEEVEQDNDQCI
ncbi:MAG: hypothetical protein MHPSP_003342, partial [Paramarteilia canceri]